MRAPSIRRFLDAGVDFVYPPACGYCGGGCGRHEKSTASSHVCRRCQQSLRQELPHRCPRCSAPVGPHTAASAGCSLCRSSRFAFDCVVSLGVYRDALGRACRMAKQPMGESLMMGLTELLWDQSREVLENAGVQWVVPIPHHWTQRLFAAHLPPVTMARVLGRCLNVPAAAHLLAKSRRTPSQSKLPPSRRRANLRGAFCIAGGARLSGETVLLVDDVLTTGTTCHRAAQVLKKAGAGPILAAVIARGLGSTPGV